MYTMLSSDPDTIHCKHKQFAFFYRRIMPDAYLSTSHGKVGKYTVFLIPVASVGLQTFSFTVVPQFEGVVQSGGQNVLAVWREFHKRDGWIIIVYECFQTLARGSVPNAAGKMQGLQ
jgi:hypothetical protein